MFWNWALNLINGESKAMSLSCRYVNHANSNYQNVKNFTNSLSKTDFTKTKLKLQNINL